MLTSLSPRAVTMLRNGFLWATEGVKTHSNSSSTEGHSKLMVGMRRPEDPGKEISLPQPFAKNRSLLQTESHAQPYHSKESTISWFGGIKYSVVHWGKGYKNPKKKDHVQIFLCRGNSDTYIVCMCMCVHVYACMWYSMGVCVCRKRYVCNVYHRHGFMHMYDSFML